MEILSRCSRRGRSMTQEAKQSTSFCVGTIGVAYYDSLPLQIWIVPAVRRRDAGPNARIRKVFEAVAALPRRQQDKTPEFAEAFVAQHREKNAA